MHSCSFIVTSININAINDVETSYHIHDHRHVAVRPNAAAPLTMIPAGITVIMTVSGNAAYFDAVTVIVVSL